MKWIASSERLPTQADADQQGCVIAWHSMMGVMITTWRHLHRQKYGFLTHWMPCPKEPGGKEKQEDV